MWEYKTISIRVKPTGFISPLPDLGPLENMLNELGRAGWELVSTQLPQYQWRGNASAVLKRKK